MKTTITSFLVTFLFFVFSLNSYGQESKARKQIGLTGLPIISLNGDSDRSTNGFALYGNLGWLLNDYDVVGVRPFYGVVDDLYSKVHSTGANIYYSRYLNRNRLSVFLDINSGVGYLWNSVNDGFKIEPSDGMLFNYSFGPGVDFELKNGLNIEFLVQYIDMRNVTNSNTTDVKAIIPSIGIQHFFG